MELDFERIAQRLQRHGLSKDQAWTAIGQTYISYITNPPETANSESELAQYFYLKCLGWHWSWVTQPCLIEQAVATKDNLMQKIQGLGDKNDFFSEDEMFVICSTHWDEESETDYITGLLELVPQCMRIPVLIVVQAILKRPPTKPLTVEACRKILQKAKICNTSEYARQVYTFLTTLKR